MKKRNSNSQNKAGQKLLESGGFTLIELLIVIGIMAILAGAVIITINPGQQFAVARDVTRKNHLNTLYSSIISYKVANQGSFGDLDIPQQFTEICNTALGNPQCQENNLVDLSPLVPHHINRIPVDSGGGSHDNGTGYFIARSSILLVAVNYETEFIAIGITEEEYLNPPPEFAGCTEEGEGSHTIGGDVVYCDSENRMWTITADQPYHWSSNASNASNCNWEEGSFEACHYCNYDIAGYGGYSDWELPDLNMLGNFWTDVCSGSSCGSENITWDEEAQPDLYWSATEEDSSAACYFVFGTGSTICFDKTGGGYVRCFRE